MSYIPLNSNDLKDAARTMKGIDIVSDIGFMDVAHEAGENVWMEGPTRALMELSNSLARDTKPENMMKGADANAKLGVKKGEEFAFDDDEEVHIEALKERDEKMFVRRMSALTNEIAESQGTMTTFASVVGGLGGGFADPVSLVGGALLGAAAVGMAARAAISARHAMVLKEFPQIVKSARASINTSSILGGSLDAMVGAAVIDGGGMLYLRNKYNQEFQAKEFMFMVAGAGVFGGLIPAAAKAVGFKGRNRRFANAKKKFVAEMQDSFGSNAGDVTEDMVNAGALADKMDAVPSEKPFFDIQQTKVWEPREDVGAMPDEPNIATREDVNGVVFYSSKKDGDKAFSEVTNKGVGTTTFIRSKGIAKSLVQDLDGKSGGSIKGLRVRNEVPVLTQSDFPKAKAKITGIFRSNIKKLIKTLDDGEVKSGVKEELDELLVNMSKAENIDELHKLAATSSVSRHSDIYFNAAVKKAGWDGYHVRVVSPDGKTTIDGITMIDGMTADQVGKGNVTAEFLDELGSDRQTGDGIQTTFDKRLSAVEDELVQKADLKNPRIKELRNQLAEIQNTEVKRMSDPRQKKGYAPEEVSKDEIADTVAKTETGKFEDMNIVSMKESVDSIDEFDARGTTTPKKLGPAKYKKVKAGEYTTEANGRTYEINNTGEKTKVGSRTIWDITVKQEGADDIIVRTDSADGDIDTLKKAKEEVNSMIQKSADEEAPKSDLVDADTRELVDRGFDRMQKAKEIGKDFINCLKGK